MCGIVGFVDRMHGASAEDLRAVVTRMASSMNYRGPDDDGAWVDAASRVALGHRRLAILDLSAEGHQPMLSADLRFVIVYNGEIYNFADLRRVLESAGHSFRGHSDTEVLLAGICEWGFAETLRKCRGMFAIGLWDRQRRTLSLARDRIGEKPLYYGWQDGVFMFCSELKPLRVHPRWRGDIDRNAIALLMRHGYIPAPYSIHRDIRKLPPGEYLTLEGDDLERGGWPEPRPYWSLRECAEAGASDPFPGGDVEAIGALEALLRESVRSQMVADVPVGAFLSGGIDSSTIVALMQAESPRPVRTFSIGFAEDRFNEAHHAKAVAAHLGTDHTELYVTADEARAVVPSLPAIYDEPFADSSQIPTYLVARLARRHVTVSLSGDGGDELFCGYSRYEENWRSWRRVRSMPWVARSGLAAVASATPSPVLNGLLDLYGWSQGRRISRRPTVEQWRSLARTLLDSSGDAFARALSTHWVDTSAVIGADSDRFMATTGLARPPRLVDFCERMMYSDTVSYLPDDILVKVDRAAMAVSLETRVPMLDQRVVEFAWRIPLHLKRRHGQGKWVLRQVLDRYVPKHLVERPKRGFGVPLDAWLRGPLRDWAESLLASARLEREGYFDGEMVRRKWVEHLDAKYDHGALLWNVLMFQSWLESSRTTAPARTLEALAV